MAETHSMCRSPVQIAEDLVVACTQVQDNVSRADATYFQIQRRELGQKWRLRAEQLLLVWEGTPQQIQEAHDINLHKQFEVPPRSSVLIT